MAERTRFGPAGVPPMFRLMGADLPDVPRLLREEGLDALEYEAVRWGQKPQISREHAEKLGVAAKQNDVRLSLHGSYFINLSGKPEIVEASKQRLIASPPQPIGWAPTSWFSTRGFTGKFEKDFAFKTCLQALKEVSAEMRSLGPSSEAWSRNHGKKIPSRQPR